MNDDKGPLPLPPVMAHPATPEIIGLLEKLLSDAKGGAFASVAIVVVTPNRQVVPFMVGDMFSDMHTGASSITTKCMEMIMAPPKTSRIVRVPGMG